MKQLFALITTIILFSVSVFAQEAKTDTTSYGKGLDIYTSIADHLTHKSIDSLTCEITRPDSTFLDSAKVEYWGEGEGRMNFVTFHLSKPGSYLLRCEAQGYQVKYVPVEIKKFYKRELNQELKTVYMKKLPKRTEIELDEVVVKATKLKFYMDGDTMVYDADAFNLAEGSMLDGLIKKLPGVEMDKGGVIKVNGRQVDALLLNGKDFFDKDRELMLENMPAYMVKNVQAYDRTPREYQGTSRAQNAKKEFVMNVKLKKEYNGGWIANTNVGGGLPMRDGSGKEDEKRFLAKLFAMKFTDQYRFTLYANANNLNDNRTPGEDNEWTPSQQATGLLSTYDAGASFNWSKESHDYGTSIGAKYNETSNSEYTNSATYLDGGNTYGRSFSASKSYEFSANMTNAYNFWGGGNNVWNTFKNAMLRTAQYVDYRKWNRNSNSASMTLNDDVASHLGKAWLDSISAPNAGELLRKYAINRNLTTAKGNGHATNASLSAHTQFSPAHNDFLMFSLSSHVQYSDNINRDYNHYLLDYPSNAAMKSDFRNRFNDNTDRGLIYQFGTSASLRLDKDMRNNLNVSYQFNHDWNKSDKPLYLLHEIEGWNNAESHPLGTLPSYKEMLHTLDKDNSSLSDKTKTTNTFRAEYNYQCYNDTTERFVFFSAGVNMPLQHERLDYQQGVVDTLMARTTFLPSPFFGFFLQNSKTMTNFNVNYNTNITAPEMTSLLNIRDDRNPLYITLGNPNLKNTVSHTLNTSLSTKLHTVLLNFEANGSITENAIASGFIYNKDTGVRTVTPQNVDGNWTARANAGIEFPVKKVTFKESVSYNYNHSVDLSGTDETLGATRSVVGSSYLNDALSVIWNPTDKLEFALDGKMNYQHSTSKRMGFTTLNVYDFNYGARAQLQLPLSIQVSTDLTMYSRRGYSDNTMNTNELVWNASVSKKLMKGKLTIQLDGFDILGNLSNVRRTINAQGMTETFYNVIPSYCLLHVGYKLSNSKKKN